MEQEVLEVEVVASEAGTESHRAEIYTPAEMTTQYKKAVAGCLEMIRFGAMMQDVDSSLTRETGARGGGHTSRDETLKGWLEANCPEINYKTALRFKALADGVRRACEIPTATPLCLVLPGADGSLDAPVENARTGAGRRLTPKRVAALRSSVWKLVEGKSARQLLFQFMTPEKRKGGARPQSERKLDPDWRHLDAEAMWSERIGWMVEDIAKKKTFLHLTRAELQMALDSLAAVRDELKTALGR